MLFRSAANKLCEGYNKKLKKMIGRLNQDMGPETVFVYTNTHDIVMEIIQQHRQYGRQMQCCKAQSLQKFGARKVSHCLN